MLQMQGKLEIVQKYYVRKKDGQIDYDHPYDIIRQTNIKSLYYVCLGEQIGCINEDGDFVIPINYDYRSKNYRGEENYHVFSWYYYDGKTLISEVYKNNRVGVINSCGEELVPCEFEGIRLPVSDENFIPVAIPFYDNSKLIWGIYDVKNKHISVTPQYEDMDKAKNGYVSFKENGKWGLLHCASGKVVIPAIYLMAMNVSDTGIVRAFFGGKCEQLVSGIHVEPEDCHILVVNGIEEAQLVVYGYKWIEPSGPSVMKCITEKQHKTKQEDSFKLLKMPDYIAIIRNATYEEGYFLKENGTLVKEWTVGCTTYSKMSHARYISGGDFSAITYDGKSIPVTSQMKLEILECISK